MSAVRRRRVLRRDLAARRAAGLAAAPSRGRPPFTRADLEAVSRARPASERAGADLSGAGRVDREPDRLGTEPASPARRRLPPMIMAALAGVAWVWLAAGPAPAEDADLSVNVPGVTNPSPSRSGLEDEYDAPIPSPTSSPSSSASTSLAPIPSSTAPGGSPGGGANTGGGTVPGGGGDGDGDGDGDGACVQVEPALPLEPADDAWAAAVDKDLYLPSHKVTATASGFEVGERVQLALFSDPRLIGNFTADAEGRVEAVFAVADDAAPGTHSIQFTGWCGAVVARADVLVGVPADPPPDDGWPAWLWWLLALGLALALAWTIRRAVRAMRDRSDRAGVAAP